MRLWIIAATAAALGWGAGECAQTAPESPASDSPGVYVYKNVAGHEAKHPGGMKVPDCYIKASASRCDYVASDGKSRTTSNCMVKGVVPLTTPAGTFQTRHVQCEDLLSGANNPRYTEVWYEPQSRIAIKVEFGTAASGSGGTTLVKIQ